MDPMGKDVSVWVVNVFFCLCYYPLKCVNCSYIGKMIEWTDGIDHQLLDDVLFKFNNKRIFEIVAASNPCIPHLLYPPGGPFWTLL